MKWLAKMARKFVRLVVMTTTLTVLIVILDAVLSPDGPDRRDRPA